MKIDLNLREDIQKYFPNFEYFNCTEPERLNFNIQNNLVGMQQEAFIYFWLFKRMKESIDGFICLDIGCGQNIHFASVGVNDYCGECHPVYKGGVYRPQVTSLAENITCFNENTFACVIASHIIEHVKDPVFAFRKWCKLLKRDGLIIVLLPNASFEKVKWDPSHINSFFHSDFERLFINTNKDLIKVECFDDLHNDFSISFVGRKI